MMYKNEKNLDAKFDAAIINERCMNFWAKNETYKFDPNASYENIYSMDTPPPTVSGSLHIGHIFGYTETDIMVRFNRMMGKNIFYPIGWDDNGLPTERRVQNYFNIKCDPSVPYDPNFHAKHLDKFDTPQIPVSRQNFIEHCRELVDMDELVFENIFRQMGMSYDFDLMYSTISNDAIKLAQENFIKLYNDKNVLSVDAPTMWDTTFQTAVATAEIEERDTPGFFHDIKFKCGNDEFVIATTRPEFLPACIAIVAHPEDERYKHLIGKTATTPLFGANVPIFGDEHADPEKGTGIMMVCTFGDAEDVKFWKEHNLPLKQIIGRDGRIVDSEFITRRELVGMPIKIARKQIVEWLRESGDLVGEPRAIMHAVKFYEKGDVPIEFVPSRQWFVQVLDKKDELIDAANKIKWTPDHMKHRFINWANGLNQNWAISRQRYFGVPFPVWYKLNENSEPLFDSPIMATALPCDPQTDCPDGFTNEMRGKPNGFIGDPDVMDTWVTSSLTPEIAMAKTDSKNMRLPFSARNSSHDIIRTWNFYTVLMKILNNGGVLPWNELLINGFVLDPDRKKMSKSKGNVVVPQDLVDKYGTEAIRLWAASVKWGIDGLADERIMDQKRKLVNKFFNAAKFVFTIVGDAQKSDVQKSQLDNTYVAKLKSVCDSGYRSFSENDYAGALITSEQAFWDFCDNYLEIVKTRAYAGDESAIATLQLSIETFAALFAPFMPFITEEVWQSRPWTDKTTSIHKTSFPSQWPDYGNSGNFDGYEKLCELVANVRGQKSSANKSMKAGIEKLTVIDNEFFRATETDIKNVLGVNELIFAGDELVSELLWS